MKILKFLFVPVIACLFTIYTINAETNPLDTEIKKLSYAVGYNIGMSLKRQKFNEPLDMNILTGAIQDLVNNRQTLMSVQDVQSTLTAYATKLEAELNAQAAANVKIGEDFLAKNAKRAEVKTTASGLQYETVTAGAGATPTADSVVKVHYRGTLLDGTEFDSSYARNEPVEFPLNQVIPGWTEGLQLMKVGGKSKLYVPANLAYGANPRPGIPGNSALIFDVELLDIVAKQQ